jgi:succinate dehydrogenase / fumarate reductase cytochrome b subunit
MKWQQVLNSSIGKKLVMAATGLFLIVFLVVHCYVNANVLFASASEKFEGENFNRAAHFMGSNLIIRITEIGLFAGLILHIVQGYKLELRNRGARKSKYAVSAGSVTSTWYSRSMAILGTLILLFLIIHLKHFWLGSRFSTPEPDAFDHNGYYNLYNEMVEVFSQGWVVVVYVLGCFSLAWHLLHGFQSAFQTLGWNTSTWKSTIKIIGVGFSILVPLIFALMPVFMFFGIKIPTGGISLMF